ncbi:MAG: hypothetical protein M1821_009555 [Bathelium mastoideum]|nr:MAG: hypothetical protein M1821_009555 [Bathelium mastoideum]KAI9688778.1 MAG: hypothetical protein M1822_001135 [Bathelium mastoideum]
MAENDELDEDLFNDLYDDDNPVPFKPSQAEPDATKFEAAETIVPHGQVSSSAEAVEQGNAAMLDVDGDDDVNFAGDDSNGYGTVGAPSGGAAGAPQYNYNQDEQPIGIKEDGKMFIGGLNWETTDQSLKDYFSQFGEVVECTVMRDGATGRSRGFGFLTFKDPKTVNIVMVKEHYLDGKIIDPKRAIPRDEQERTSKIFVGGVSQEATEQEFKHFFMQFGRVLDATLMMDKDTGRPRGFGFVTFDSEAAVDSTLAQPLEIHGKMIEVKKAQPRGNLQKEEEERKFGRQKGGFQGNNQGNFGNEQGNQQGQNSSTNNNGNNNMSPAMMAQYWQRMQQYFQMMQQSMAAAMAQQQNGAGMGGMGGMNQMNPQMMQQMMAMQQQAQNQQRGGTPNPQSPTGGQPGMGQMNPQMMQQMMQQSGMSGGFGGQGGSGMASPMNGGPGTRPGFTAQEQLAFEQQKYERQQAQRMTQGGYAGAGPGGPTSWEGMYDDVPQPNFSNQGGGRGNMGSGAGGFGGRQNSPYQGGGGGRGNRAQNNTPQPTGNPSAPANAPTGPKNAGKPGANYRGGGMRGGHRGFHPYARG